MIDLFIVSFSVIGGALIGASLHAAYGKPVPTLETKIVRADRDNVVREFVRTDDALMRACHFCAREHGGDEAAWRDYFLGNQK